MEAWMAGCIGRYVYEWIDRYMDGWTDSWIDKYIKLDRQINMYG
jgi:hypothetical protein